MIMIKPHMFTATGSTHLKKFLLMITATVTAPCFEHLQLPEPLATHQFETLTASQTLQRTVLRETKGISG